MPRVLFRCDAGRADGLGHLMRCLVLADALRAAGAAVTFLVGGDAPAALTRVAQRGHRALAGGTVATAADLDQLTGLPRDVLVIDSRRTTPAYANALARVGLTVCIDDDGLAQLEVDMVVNAGLDAAPALYPGRAAQGRDLLGPAFNLIDPGFFVARPLRPRAARLLLTFGGEDPANHSRWAIEQLAPAMGESQISVVVGPAHPDAASVARAAAARAVELVEAPPSMVPSIAAADIAVSAGGTTCYELAAAGVPTLAIAIEPHQEPLIAALARHGACVRLGAGFDIDIAAARQTLHKYATDADARRTMHAAQKKLFAQPGAPPIARRILQAYRERAA